MDGPRHLNEHNGSIRINGLSGIVLETDHTHFFTFLYGRKKLRMGVQERHRLMMKLSQFVYNFFLH